MSADETKEKILDVAEKLFAQKGYKNTSVREITKAAGCNIAAVNYHFGSKKNLYIEVFKRKWLKRAKAVGEAFRKDIASKKDLSAKDVIKSLAKAFIKLETSPQERILHLQLIAREMLDPTEAADIIIDKEMIPFFYEVMDLLKKLIPEFQDEEKLKLCVLSVFAQIMHFNTSRAIVARLIGKPYEEIVDDLIEHIADFSVKGMKNA